MSSERAPARGGSPRRRETVPIERPPGMPPNAAPLPARVPVKRPPPRQGPFPSAFSRVMARLMAYPFERIRLGLQTQAFLYSEEEQLHDWSGGYWAVAKSVIEAEGILGLWAGLPVTVVERISAELIGVIFSPYLNFNLFSAEVLTKNFPAWLTNNIFKYAVSHVVRHMILNPLVIAQVQITSDLGIAKNKRRAQWLKDQEEKKKKEAANKDEEEKTEKEGEKKDDEEESEEPKEDLIDPEELKKIEAWWPLPLTAWTVIERVYEKEGLRGLLAGYPSTLAGAIVHRMLSLCMDTSMHFLATAYDLTGPLPLLSMRLFGSSLIGLLTYPFSTAAHVCMAQVGRVPMEKRVAGGSELWTNVHVMHTPETWQQGAFSIGAAFVNFGFGVVLDIVTRRGQRGRAPQRMAAPPVRGPQPPQGGAGNRRGPR